jgi:hypothetical protein
MHDCANAFLHMLDREDDAVSQGLARDRYGIGLISAIREVDYYDHQARRHDASEERHEHMYLLRLGLPRLVRRTFERVTSFDVPVVTFARDQHNARGALERLAVFGLIEHGRRMAYASIAGECRISQVDSRLFEFRLPANFLPLDHLESSVEGHYIAAAQTRMNEALRAAFTSGMEEKVQRLLRENVYVWRGRHIGYNADPTIDRYFFVQAFANLKLRPGVDSFSPELRFGGVQFIAYVLCAAYFLSLARKHVAFCEALVGKHPDIELANIITVTGPRDGLIDTIVECLNELGGSEPGYVAIGRAEAETLYSVLSARRDNITLLEGGLMTVPFVVEYSDTSVVHSISGAQLDPIGFLLSSLRYHHPRDYDRHQRSREAAMQASIRRLLGETLPWVELRDNITLRAGGRKVTDIDLVAFDPRSGTAMLFQLKHQDRYAGDMRKRASRATRLLSETQRWLGNVREWLAATGEQQLSAALRLGRGQTVKTVRFVAVSRNFAHFLHPLAAADDFAFATITQFFDAVVRLHAQGDFKTMPGLFALLRRFMPNLLAQPIRFDPEEHVLPSVTFRIVQDSDASLG